ncbi:hypothetical protein [Microvirga terricola]|uniref:DUF1328 domain-containing protein n=1 Tax=Microvirga terricola TaxID=2719797 RepID=A0ABX0VCR1_9HYPH|nr:hypothetical protein [Microvirga terricola]NIX76881.1 hypothetical protein [Microvirga terricola]
MITWAVIVALVSGALAYISGDLFSLAVNVGELLGVIALFALVCAAEAFN